MKPGERINIQKEIDFYRSVKQDPKRSLKERVDAGVMALKLSLKRNKLKR